jgi:hypothetical protein
VRRRIEELEARMAVLPRVIDDDMIVEVLSEPASNAPWLEGVLVEVYRRIGPALKASFEKGVGAWRFCNTRGVVRPRPVGALDRLAWGMSLDHGPYEASFSQPWHLSYKPIEMGGPTFEGLPALWKDWTPVHTREFLVIFLNLYLAGWKDPWVAIRTSTTRLPIFTSEESGRLLKLIEPLQLFPDPDLPLLVWKDPDKGVRTSWPDGGRGLWTPIDVGLNRPALFLLAHPDQSGDCGDTPVLSNASPAAIDVLAKPDPQGARELPPHLLWKHLTADAPAMTDEDIISRLTTDLPTLGIGLTTAESFCLAVEEPLRASLLIGAAAYRTQRARGVSNPSPTSTVEIVAALLSFESLAEMPDDLATKCGWFTPESDRYDFGGNTASGSPQRARVEAVALRILLERHRIQTLRRHQFNIDDLPTLGNDEGNRLRSLVAPLEQESQGSLPWLIWRDQTGTIQTSQPETGQWGTWVDNDLLYLIEHLFDERWEVSPFEDENVEVKADEKREGS